MTLETYVNEPRRLTIAGVALEVGPLRVRQIPSFARAIAPAAGLLFAGDILAAVAEHGESLITAMAVATGMEEEWLGGLTADEFLEIAAAVVEVNADFFVQRVVPMMTGLADRLMPEATGTAATPGATPSPSSSPTATATATASTTP